MWKLGLLLVLVGAISYIALTIVFSAPAKKEEEEEKVLTPLDFLKRLVSQEQDELTDLIKSISKIGEDLLFGHTDHEVARGVLDQWEVYIRGYVEKALTFSKRYRNSTIYLRNVDPAKVKRDVEILTGKVKRGEKVFEKTLNEKQDTLNNIETIRKNRLKIEALLWETEATLQSLQGSIVSVETGNKDEKAAMQDMHSTVTNLSKALDQTAVELEEEEAFKEEKVEATV